jgi:hypothetical protein
MNAAEENRWEGEMRGRTVNMKEHFPKHCSNEQCAMGGAINLMPHHPSESTGM